MDTVLWIVQSILAIKLITIVFDHGLRPTKVTMQTAMQRIGKASYPLHAITGVVACLLASGLILPGLLGAPAAITAAAAALTGMLLLGSIYLHMRSREKPMIFVSVALFALAAFVAYGRWPTP